MAQKRKTFFWLFVKFVIKVHLNFLFFLADYRGFSTNNRFDLFIKIYAQADGTNKKNNEKLLAL